MSSKEEPRMTPLTIPVTAVDSLAPLTHREGMSLFAAELGRNLDLMRSLSDDDWTTQTECPDWDVRRMYLHVLGACESGASVRELVHQMLAARSFQKAHGGPQEAALSATQVAERIDLTPQQLQARFASVAPRAVRGRTRMPALVRRVSLPVDGPVVERWTVGYLIDTIYLRDAWMHRMDVTRATGRAPVLSPEHDGRIVADVVAEWSRRHGQPFSLTLTGTAGGQFTARGGGAPEDAMTLDAVEFCRILAGRSPGDGLLTTIVPF
jgi:uncharacterized protein (TIGR03083 family)